MSPFFYFYCFLKTLKMAFNTSSCITSFRSPGARVKVSDTKICPHCTAPTLIKNGFPQVHQRQLTAVPVDFHYSRRHLTLRLKSNCSSAAFLFSLSQISNLHNFSTNQQIYYVTISDFLVRKPLVYGWLLLQIATISDN